MDDQFRTVFSLVDRFSAPVLAIGAKVQALNASLARLNNAGSGAFADTRVAANLLGQELTRLATNAGLSNIGRRARELRGEMRTLGSGIGHVLAPLTGLAALGSGAGLLEVMHGAIDSASAMEDLIARTGQTAQALGALRMAGNTSGVAIEETVGAVNKLTSVMADAQSGRNNLASRAFANLGIDLRTTTTAFEAMVKIAERFDQLDEQMSRGEAQKRKEQYSRILMGRAGGNLIPMFPDLPKAQAELARLNALARRVPLAAPGQTPGEMAGAHRGRYLPTITAAERAGMDELGDQFEYVKAGVSNIRNAIGRELAPMLLPVVLATKDWLAVNREIIASNVRSFIVALGGAFRDLWRETKAMLGLKPDLSFAEIAHRAMAAAGGVVNLKLVVGSLAVVFGFKVVAAIARATRAILLFAAAPLVAMVRMGVALAAFALANPILAAVAVGLAAVGVGIFYAYRNWDRLVSAMRPALDWMDRRLKEIGEIIRTYIVEPFERAGAQWRALTGGAEDNGPDLGMTPAERNGARRALPPPRRGTLRGASPVSYGRTFYPGGTGPEAVPAGGSDSTITVRFENTPQGTRINADRTNRGGPVLDVGYGFGQLRTA